MILLDANVVSEIMASDPEPQVERWFDGQTPTSLFISAIMLSELEYGVLRLPDGRRKSDLRSVLGGMLAMLPTEVLPFDDGAARRHAALRVAAQAAGRTLPAADGYIAAITSVHGLTVATRDAAPFRAAGLRVVDPWAGG